MYSGLAIGHAIGTSGRFISGNASKCVRLRGASRSKGGVAGMRHVSCPTRVGVSSSGRGRWGASLPHSCPRPHPNIVLRSALGIQMQHTSVSAQRQAARGEQTDAVQRWTGGRPPLRCCGAPDIAIAGSPARRLGGGRICMLRPSRLAYRCRAMGRQCVHCRQRRSPVPVSSPSRARL